jgi:hypothetical protein
MRIPGSPAPRAWVARVSLLVSLLICFTRATIWADAIVVTRAMQAETIAERVS